MLKDGASGLNHKQTKSNTPCIPRKCEEENPIQVF